MEGKTASLDVCARAHKSRRFRYRQRFSRALVISWIIQLSSLPPSSWDYICIKILIMAARCSSALFDLLRSIYFRSWENVLAIITLPIYENVIRTVRKSEDLDLSVQRGISTSKTITHYSQISINPSIVRVSVNRNASSSQTSKLPSEKFLARARAGVIHTTNAQ